MFNMLILATQFLYILNTVVLKQMKSPASSNVIDYKINTFKYVSGLIKNIFRILIFVREGS